MKRRGIVVWIAGAISTAGCIGIEQLGRDGSGGERVDARGTIEITIDGSSIDLTEDRFQAEHAENSSLAFHFHESDEYWYMEGDEPVSFAEAIDHVPHFEYANEEGEHVLSYESVYDGGDPDTEIAFRVDGDGVDPAEYELEDGDHLEVEVETAE